MGFLNGFLKGLGFESQSGETDLKDKSVTYKTNSVEYNLNDIVEQQEEKIHTPQNQEEVQSIVDRLKQGCPVTVNFEQLSNSDFIRALDFMSGATYVLNGKIKKLGNKIFFFCPNLKERF